MKIKLSIISKNHKISMASHVTPFLILNIGSEMLFVISQRLDAQQVQQEKATIVRNEITSALFANDITSVLFDTRPPFTHEAVRNFLENVAHASYMQLDKYSMNKLWDLITMIYKWQTTMSSDIIHVTNKHISELKTLVSSNDTLLLLENTQQLFNEYVKQFSPADLTKIRECLLAWLSVFNVRVSILIKLGLQNQDGSFNCDLEQFDENCTAMLRNLGTNIYATQKIINRTEDRINKECCEITTFVNELLGDAKMNHNLINFKINTDKIISCTSQDTTAPLQLYTDIDCSEQYKICDIFNSLEINENNGGSFTDDLINIIEEDSYKE